MTAFGSLFSSTPFQGGARLPRGGGLLSFLAKKKVTKESCPTQTLRRAERSVGASLRIRSTRHASRRSNRSNDCQRTRIGPLCLQKLHAQPILVRPIIGRAGAFQRNKRGDCYGAAVVRAHWRFPMVRGAVVDQACPLPEREAFGGAASRFSSSGNRC